MNLFLFWIFLYIWKMQGPQYVCTNFWTFICTTCSGIQWVFSSAFLVFLLLVIVFLWLFFFKIDLWLFGFEAMPCSRCEIAFHFRLKPTFMHRLCTTHFLVLIYICACYTVESLLIVWSQYPCRSSRPKKLKLFKMVAIRYRWWWIFIGFGNSWVFFIVMLTRH